MNFWKRTFATLAAFAILLGAVPELPAPLAAPVFAADEDTEAVGPNDKTAFLVTLADGKTEETWSFNDVRRGWRQENGSAATYTKAVQQKNIEASGSELKGLEIEGKTARSLSAEIDGAGKTITLADGTELSPETGRYSAGLFPYVEGGSLKNITVLLEGGVFYIQPASPSIGQAVYHAGILVGEIYGGNIKNCAVVSRVKTGSLEIRNVSMGLGSYSVGGLAGWAHGGTSIDGCYSDADVYAGLGSGNISGTYKYVGGLVGLMGDSSTAVSNCAYYGQKVYVYDFDPERCPSISRRSASAGALAGGTEGGAGLQNSYAHKGAVRIYDIQEGNGGTDIRNTINDLGNRTNPLSGFPAVIGGGAAGTVAGNTAAGFSSVYSQFTCHVNSNGLSYDGKTGTTATASRLGASWIDVNTSIPNLKWLVGSGAPEVKVTGSPWPPTVAITPYPMAGNDWRFDASVPVMGTMPTANPPAGITIDSSAGMAGVVVAPHGVAGKDDFYAGLTYDFVARLSGVTSTDGFRVNWSAGPEPAATADGALAIPAESAGIAVTVTAAAVSTASGSTVGTGSYSFTPKAGDLKVTSTAEEVEPGGSVGVGAEVTSGLPEGWDVVFSVEGKPGTEVTKEGGGYLLNAAPDETGTGGKLTVTATAENAGFPGARLTASKEITLKEKAPGPEYADELQLAPAEGGSGGGRELLPGQKVKLSVTAPTVPEGAVPGALSTTAWSGGGLDGATGASVEYTAPADGVSGTVTITATLKVGAGTDDAPGEVDYTAVFSITAKTPDTPDTPTAGRVTVTVPSPDRLDGSGKHVEAGDPGGPVRNHYTLTFNAHTVSDRDNKTVMDVLAYYKYQFVKANANVNESGFAESEKDDNVTDLSGSAETGIGFSLKDPAADNAVYLKLYIDGDNASRTRGGAVVYKVPLASWSTALPPEPGWTADEGKPVGSYTASVNPYKPDHTPEGAESPTAMDLSRLEYLDSRDSTSHTGFTEKDLVSGKDIEITNVRLSRVPFDALYEEYFLPSGSGSGNSGGRTNPPVFSTGKDGIIDESIGIVITVPGEPDAVIRYTTSVVDEGENFTDPTRDTGTVYAGPIPFPTDKTTFGIKAIATAGDKLPSTVSYIRYNSTTNIGRPDPPELRLNGLAFDPAMTYPSGSKIHFTHPFLGKGAVRFTIDGSTPTEANAKEYNEQEPLDLPGDYAVVTIRAYFKRTDVPDKVSDTVSFPVRVRQALDGPAASVNPNTSVTNGQSLLFTLSDKTLEQLDSNYGTSGAFLQRVTYHAADGLHDSGGKLLTDLVMQDSGSENDASISLDRASDAPQDGAEYINCILTLDNFAMPTLQYVMGDEDPIAAGTAYSYGLRTVTSTTDDAGVTTYTVSYRNPQTITLEGEPKKSVTVKAAVLTKSETYDNSAVSTFLYRLLDRTAAPEASPKPPDDEALELRPDETIKLSSKTAGASIYYTDDDTPPALKSDGTPDGTTRLYDPKTGIPMNKDALTFYIIRAFAVTPGYDQSEVAVFRYQLPARVQAVLASPDDSDEIVKGTKVTLTCTTRDATIYYTTNDSTPEPYKSPVYSSPIQIDEDTVIRAIAEKDGMQSAEAVYDYEVAGTLKKPSSSLDSGSVVYKGTRIRLSGKETIAYTVDGSDPKAILKEDDKKDSSGGGTTITVTTGEKEKDDQVLYGENVVIDADFGESVTVTAFCYGGGKTPSETSTFTYTICEKEDYLTAVPPAGSVLRPDDSVTLTTSLTDGMIFYTVGGDAPDVRSSGSSYRHSARGDAVEGSTVPVEGEPGSTFTIRATAVQDGGDGGTTVVFSYQIAERTPAPTASIPSGAVTLDGAAVVLTVKEGDIFYTTDGADPTTSSTLYTGPISVTGSMVLKAVAVAEGKEPSEIVQYVYTHAGQTAAPVMSVPGGEIEQGTKVELKTETLGAVIYYTTDGTEPTEQSMTYTAPVTIMRPVTLKAKAALPGLHDSVVNAATYTVFEPEKPETENEADKLLRLETDRLASRRTYSDETAGPSFSDVVLVDTQFNAVLSAPDGSVPGDARLVIRRVEPSRKERQAVQTQFGYAIVSAFEVTLERGGEEIGLSGEAELGLPVPADYQNGVVMICRLAEDGSVEACDTRRSGGIAYAMRDHLSKYAIIVPEAAAAMSGGARSGLPWALGGLAASAAAAGIVLAALRRRRKKQRSEDLPEA